MRAFEFSYLSPPTLKGERVNLRPVTPDDYRILFQWHSELGGLHLWWADGQLLSFAEFVSDFRKRSGTSVPVILMVELIGEGRTTPVGMTYIYNTNPNDCYTYWYMYLASEVTEEGVGPEAGALFVDYLFSYFGFRKIYTEIPRYDASSVEVALRNGFAEEGCLRGHRWFGDRYWDLHILSISRESYEQMQRKSGSRTSPGREWVKATVSTSSPAPENGRLQSRQITPHHTAVAFLRRFA